MAPKSGLLFLATSQSLLEVAVRPEAVNSGVGDRKTRCGGTVSADTSERGRITETMFVYFGRQIRISSILVNGVGQNESV